MQNIKTSTVYTEIDASKRLPEEKAICFRNGIPTIFEWKGADLQDLKITSWLEKKEDQIVMDKETFLKAIGDAFNAGEEYQVSGEKGDGTAPDFEQYISNLIKH